MTLPPLGVYLEKLTEYAVTWRYVPMPECEQIDLDHLRLNVVPLNAAAGLRVGLVTA